MGKSFSISKKSLDLVLMNYFGNAASDTFSTGYEMKIFASIFILMAFFHQKSPYE
jgi:hypothetical protein